LQPFEVPFIYLFLFVFGACIGSFANVCIARIPKSLSVVLPGSLCPVCKKPIKFYDNIPILSYLLLRGRCRNCGVKIGPRYLLVEIVSGAAALLIFSYHGISLGLLHFIFFELLLIISCIDIDHRIIPNILSLPGILFFFVVSFLSQGIITWQESFLGIMAGGGILYLIALMYYGVKKTCGMGGGDIKLLAMVGAFTGWQGVLFTLFLSSLTGTITGIGIILSKQKFNMKIAIPFGPFISFAAVVYLWFGDQLIYWYLN
jgi:leader peptidase (prepilin peptidase)/N-methyltransferase